MFENKDWTEKRELSYGDEDYEVDRLFGYNKANEILKVCRINPRDPFFNNVYSLEDKEKDEKEVIHKENKWKKNNDEMAEKNKQMATILEAILYQQIDQNMIFGDIETISTCKFDDYVNGVDSIMQISNQKTGKYDYSAIAYDVAMSSDEDSMNLKKKVNIIEKNIQDGRLSYVKYFKSDKDPERTSLDNIPKLIIGIDFKTLQNIFPLWCGDFHEQIRNEHPLRFIILDQIILQIKYFIDYAQKYAPEDRKKYIVNGHEELLYCKEDIISEYQKLLSFFENFNNEKDTQSLRDKILNDPEKHSMYCNDNVLKFFNKLSIKK